jgi:hypothetical protein
MRARGARVGVIGGVPDELVWLARADPRAQVADSQVKSDNVCF